jgi:hypothetical protein
MAVKSLSTLVVVLPNFSSELPSKVPRHFFFFLVWQYHSSAWPSCANCQISKEKRKNCLCRVQVQNFQSL